MKNLKKEYQQRGFFKKRNIIEKNLVKKIISEINSIIEDNGLSEYVKFTGLCADMPAAYKISDIVVSPANKPEGFGRIIIESQSMNVPVIASAHGGSLELIKNNYNGLLFKPNNEHDLADKLKYLLLINVYPNKT